MVHTDDGRRGISLKRFPDSAVPETALYHSSTNSPTSIELLTQVRCAVRRWKRRKRRAGLVE